MVGARRKLMWARRLKLSHCRCFVGKRNMLVRSVEHLKQNFTIYRGGAHVRKYIRCPNMEDENELIALRRKKLEALRAKKIEPFGTGFDVNGSIAELREKFKKGEPRRGARR